jgi:predicted chitinase
MEHELPSGSQNKRSAGAGVKRMSPGPYLAKVVSHLDSKRQGGLKVQLLSNVVSSNEDEQEGQLFNVRYCMPFYGVNNVDSNTKNTDYYHTQQSYGFWAVPPDPGVKVLVIFAEGLPNQGFWIGCVQDDYMNWMVPGGYPSDKGSNIIQKDVPNDFKNLPLPVGEFNKRVTVIDGKNLKAGMNPDKFARPHNPMMTAVLGQQGLEQDIIRGLTSTTSRRDVPNTVYGWNTPGPLDKRTGKPKGRYGEAQNKVNYFRSRLGGSAFTMDDGDPTLLREGPATQVGAKYYDIETTPGDVVKADVTLPFNEHIKLKTRTGHQILLHNTEDLIYIGNAKGSAWIELTGNGKIDIYSQDSINIRTETDLNITADRDINMQSGRDTNFTTGRDFKHRVNQDSDVSVAKDSKEFVGADRDVWVGALNTRAVGEDEDVQIKGTQRTTINGDYNLQVSQDGHIAINANFHSKVVGDYRQTVNGAFNLNTLGDNKLTSYGSTQIRSFLNNKFDANTGNTEIKSGVNHLETAGNHIHMNSTIPATSADTADSIGDTFTLPVTNLSMDNNDQVLDKDNQVINDADGNPLRVTADANRADEAKVALRPRRIPRHEPWDAHENYNPKGHTPGVTVSIESPSPEVRVQSPLIDKDADQPDYTETSGIYNAQDPFIEKDGKRVREEIEVVPSRDTDGTTGIQPADPVPVIEQQRYFLGALIKKLGLSATTWQSQNATALAMAMAQVQKECAFEPKCENMRYSADRLIAVWPNRFNSTQGRIKARQLADAGPSAIANSVYGNRMGNGAASTGDGYRYRGRGLIQITGKNNYKKYGGLAGVDIIKNPDLANDPKKSTDIACAYLASKSITWTSTDFNSLGSEFQKAVGYAGGQSNTNSRIKLGKGFYQRIINNELTPIYSLSTTTPIDVGEGTATVKTKDGPF